MGLNRRAGDVWSPAPTVCLFYYIQILYMECVAILEKNKKRIEEIE
jgi:hypothetical protein